MKKILFLFFALASYSNAFGVVLDGTVSCEADSQVTLSGVQVTADRGADNRSGMTDANGQYGPFFNMIGTDPWTVQVPGIETTPPSYAEVFTDASNTRNFTVAVHPDCPTAPQCGDGNLDPNEACDDGNNIDGDGCSAICTIESYCGDGILDAGEMCDDGNNVGGDGCSAVCSLEGGGEGCTPGYWKQKQHFDSYTSPYSPDTLFADVFDDAFPDMTLRDVLRQGGGGLKALGRHAVAALLNAASSDVSYDRTPEMVVDSFNASYASGGYETLKNIFESFNEQGCPLN